MKQYAIGLITGILLTASAIMFMGATGSSEVGRYQISVRGPFSLSESSRYTMEPVFWQTIIDTKTGEVKERNKVWSTTYYTEIKP